MKKEKGRHQAAPKVTAAQKGTAAQKFPAWVWIVVAVVVAAIVIGVVVFGRPATSTANGAYPDEVSISQAAQKRDQGAFILDVREPDEWQQVHIPDATLIPLGELPNRLNELPKDREVVVVCRSGNRSAKGRDILRGAGFTKVTSMAGGMNQWQAQGLPTTSGQ